jgi:putative phosphoribosyl transferase
VIFQDRVDAGVRLAAALERYRSARPLVLGLPRGGVPVAYEVARALGAPLDVWIVRKLGAPGQPELGMGAVSEGGAVFRDRKIIEAVAASDIDVARIVARETAEVDRRVRLFRGSRPAPPVRDRTVIVVDDGVATGGTTRAALLALRSLEPRRLVLAVPVGARETIDSLRAEVDDVVCLYAPENLGAIGAFYLDFRPTSDDEVLELLRQAAAERPSGAAAGGEPGGLATEREVNIAANGDPLEGTLTLPRGARGIVLFAHGSGSSRRSPRNRYVAGVLNRRGLATLLFDLLTPAEESGLAGDQRFNIDLLAGRLLRATDWVESGPETQNLRIGYFGASTGAAAALVAAADWPDVIEAVVSRGGRPDLAGDALPRVKAPTLLVVGGEDHDVLALNRAARRRLRAETELVVVPGATHLFEEAGALEKVADLAAGWFIRHLGGRAARATA